MNNIRKAPLPPWWNDTPYRICRWCGKPINGDRGWRRMHDDCYEQCRVATDPRHARKRVFERDGGVCHRCGESHDAWDVDHIFPLELVDRTARWQETIRFWLMSNLQTLCKRCHREKTDVEAGRRAKVARIRERDGLKRKRKTKRERYYPLPF